MSYPRNAASPPIYDVGSLVQISDGALQTSGASARVKIGSGAWGAAAGTLDCDATSGIWTYVPSQAETNADTFILAVYKTGCLSISRTIAPSASATAGRVVLSSETHAGAVIPTVTTLTGHTPQTGDSFARIGETGSGLTSLAPASTALSTAVWTSTIAGRIDAAISTRSTFAGGAVASVTGNVGGNVAGSVGSVTAAVTVGTNNDKSGYSLATAPPTAAAIADAVWDELRTGHTTDGTFGFYLDAAISGVAAGSGATAAQVWEYSTRSLTQAVELDSGALDPVLAAIAAIAAGGLTTQQAAQLAQIHAGLFPEDPDVSPVVITPGPIGTTTGWSVCVSKSGVPEAGVVCTARLGMEPANDVGRWFDGVGLITATSASNGVVQFAGLVPGCTYYFRRGTKGDITFTVPADHAANTIQLPSLRSMS